MKEYNYKNLRNVGLIGHGATGKTSLAESLLFYTNNIDRLGKVEDGTTVMDYEQEEKKRKISLSTSVASFEDSNVKINIVDMPGYFDFQGEMAQGMRAVDIATIVVCAASGIQVGTEKAWDYCEKIKLPRAFFVNKMDRENANFDKVLDQMKEMFGTSVVPIQYPIGKESDFNGIINVISKTALVYNAKTSKMETSEIPEDLKDKVEECKQMVMEAVAETDEELEKMGKGAGSAVGTGGMATKIEAAKIATEAGADMMIANGDNIYAINDIMAGKKVGTLFLAKNHRYDGENELGPERDAYRMERRLKRNIQYRMAVGK